MDSARETILIVDDEKAILDISTEYLNQKGYRVITAENGFEAVKILEKETIACCFTDINMPGMDGLQLAEHIQKKDMTIPVIIMTGYPTIDNTIQTVKNGVVDFLIKPVSLKQLGLCLQRALIQKKLLIENIMLHHEIKGKKRIEELNRQLIEKINELNNFNKIMTDFAKISSSRELFDTIVSLSREIVEADIAEFFIIPGKKTAPNLIAVSRSERAESFESKGVFEKYATEIAKDGLPFLIKENRPESSGLPDSIRSAMIVPMKIREKTFGVVTVSLLDEKLRFDEQCLYQISFLAQKAADTAENIALYETISENLFSTLRGFVKAVEMKDAYTKEHSNRVAEMAVVIAREMGCFEEELNIIDMAGKLHDIGKIGIADNILLKPGRLTDEEFEIIKQHPELGSSIIGQLGLWSRETEIIRHHHERYDGNGYPDRLKGENIPFLARILSVADAYDAMASDRAYRKKMEFSKVAQIIREGAGSQFDPDVVKAFMKLVDEERWQFT